MRFSLACSLGQDLSVCEVSNRWKLRKYLNETDENTPFGDWYIQQHASSAPKFFLGGEGRRPLSRSLDIIILVANINSTSQK